MTVIFCGTNPNTGFGFMIADDLQIRGGDKVRRRCDKVHLINNRFGVAGFGLDTAPEAASILTQFPDGVEVRGGIVWRRPGSIDELIRVVHDLIQRLARVQAAGVRALPANDVAFLQTQGCNLVIFDCATCEMVLCEFGNVFTERPAQPSKTVLAPQQVYQFGARPNGASRIFSPEPLTQTIEAKPWDWVRPVIGRVRAECPGLVGDWGAGLIARGGVSTYRTAFLSPQDFADSIWTND